MLLTIIAAASMLHIAHPPKIIPPGEGEVVEVPFHPVFKLLGERENETALTFYEFRVPPRSAGAPPHTHTHEDEFFYVVSGTASFMSGEEVTVAPPGTFAALTRGHLHAFWNDTDEEVVLLLAVSTGKFEGFFDAVAVAMREEKPGSPQEVGALVGRLGAENGITIDMSKVPEGVRSLYGM
jgi:quercetin dioxygenase-like cupin family protein